MGTSVTCYVPKHVYTVTIHCYVDRLIRQIRVKQVGCGAVLSPDYISVQIID
jgi:hypothetical protein